MHRDWHQCKVQENAHPLPQHQSKIKLHSSCSELRFFKINLLSLNVTDSPCSKAFQSPLLFSGWAVSRHFLNIHIDLCLHQFLWEPFTWSKSEHIFGCSEHNLQDLSISSMVGTNTWKYLLWKRSIAKTPRGEGGGSVAGKSFLTTWIFLPDAARGIKNARFRALYLEITFIKDLSLESYTMLTLTKWWEHAALVGKH